MDKKRIGERTAALLLCLCLCVSLCAETAAAAGEPVTSITREYAAETVLEGEAVCPLLLPGGTDSVLYVRWISRHSDPVTVHYGPDDGSGRLPAKHATAEAAPGSTTSPLSTAPSFMGMVKESKTTARPSSS